MNPPDIAEALVLVLKPLMEDDKAFPKPMRSVRATRVTSKQKPAAIQWAFGMISQWGAPPPDFFSRWPDIWLG